MKQHILSLSFFFAFLGLVSFANAQTRTDVAELLSAVQDAEKEMVMLLPAVQKVREAAGYVPIIKSAQELAAKVKRAGSGMSKSQYEGFQRELGKIEANLDSQSQTQSQQTPHTCHGKCAADFPGWGGGKGWQRFICKLGCIKVGPVSGGNN
ncbi:MAG: hypothetical protein JNJ90_19315 [Saprospiraceae bacterium]|nr:hypothetical protein [Saprospiraceae bacterium]